MLAIEMLPGGHGDALVVEYGTGADTHRILIDGGTARSWDAVRERLKARPDQTYEAMVITHVDEDHIGGSLQILADPDLRHRIRDIWFNGFVHCERGGSVLGPVDGERLTQRINDGPFRWNDPFPDRVSNKVGGPVVVSASALACCWLSVGNGSAGASSLPSRPVGSRSDMVEQAAAPVARVSTRASRTRGRA